MSSAPTSQAAKASIAPRVKLLEDLIIKTLGQQGDMTAEELADYLNRDCETGVTECYQTIAPRITGLKKQMKVYESSATRANKRGNQIAVYTVQMPLF